MCVCVCVCVCVCLMYSINEGICCQRVINFKGDGRLMPFLIYSIMLHCSNVCSRVFLCCYLCRDYAQIGVLAHNVYFIKGLFEALMFLWNSWSATWFCIFMFFPALMRDLMLILNLQKPKALNKCYAKFTLQDFSPDLALADGSWKLPAERIMIDTLCVNCSKTRSRRSGTACWHVAGTCCISSRLKCLYLQPCRELVVLWADPVQPV